MAGSLAVLTLAALLTWAADFASPHTFGGSTDKVKCAGDTYEVKFAPGHIKSPNYAPGQLYPPDDTCYWLVEGGCNEDTLTIYDDSHGSESQSGNMLVPGLYQRHEPLTYCGSRLPRTYVSTYNHVYLAFNSDKFRTGRGFNIRYDFMDADFYRPLNVTERVEDEPAQPDPSRPLAFMDRCYDKRHVLNSERGCITSPNYGRGSYPARDACYWMISSEPGTFLKLRFESFALSSTHRPCELEPDKLMLFNGDGDNTPPLATLCGSHIPANIDTVSNTLYAKFLSTGTRQLSGFKMCWESSPINNCDMTLVEPLNKEAFSASSHFSEQYPFHAKLPDCCWSSKTPTEPGAYLQINFLPGALYRVTRIGMRGNPATGEWVTRFALSYQTGENDKWFEYTDAYGFRRTFAGNTDPSTVASIQVEPPISSARAIRILPLAARQWMTMTVDIFGCQDPTSLPRYTVNENQLYDPIPTSRCNGDTRTLEAPSGFISSPGFPHPYSSNDVCLWKIVSPSTARIRIASENFKMEDSYLCANDKIVLYDGDSTNSPVLGTYCGDTSPPTLISTGSQMMIKFYSDGTVQDVGFRLHYDFVHRWEAGDNAAVNDLGHVNDFIPNNNELSADAHSSTERCNGVTKILSQHSGYIRSPRFGISDYPNTELCYWQILGQRNSRVRLTFEMFDVAQSNFDCSHSGDALTVYDGADEGSPSVGSYCGNRQIDPIVLSKHVGFLKFKSNSRITAPGFKIKYELVDSHHPVVSAPSIEGRIADSPVQNRCAGRRKYLYDNNGLIFSPGFQNGSYSLNDQCYWTITAATQNQKIRLVFKKFSVGEGGDTICPNDYVEVHDGPNERASRVALLCGNSPDTLPTPITSSGRYLAIRFISSDVNTPSKGFAAYYSFVPNSGDFKTNRYVNVTPSTPPVRLGEPPIKEGKCGGRYFVLQLNRGQEERVGTSTRSKIDQCNWMIVAPTDTRIQITFIDFMLQGSALCRADALTIYDGTSTKDRRLLRVCGSWLPESVVTTSPRALIKFVTSTTMPEAYFHAIVRVLAPGEEPTLPIVTPEPFDSVEDRKEPIIERTTRSPYEKQTTTLAPTPCRRANPCPPDYRCIIHRGMGFCIPGNPYVPVDAETAALLASNPFIESGSYLDVNKWSKIVAVLGTSTPNPYSQESSTVWTDWSHGGNLPSYFWSQPPTRKHVTTTTTTSSTTTTTTAAPPPDTNNNGLTARCGGQSYVFMSTTQGTIASPGYDRSIPYADQDSCFWQIEAPEGFNGIRLTLVDFDLGWSSDCSADHMKIYDDSESDRNVPDTLIATLCGTPRPDDPKAVFTTIGRRVLIAFYAQSPGPRQHRGFNIAFSAVRAQ